MRPNGGEDDEALATTSPPEDLGNKDIFVIYGSSSDSNSSISTLPNDLPTSSSTASLPPIVSPTSYKAVIAAHSIMTYRPEGFDDGMKVLTSASQSALKQNKEATHLTSCTLLRKCTFLCCCLMFHGFKR